MARPRQISDDEIDAAARATFLKHGPSAPVSLIAQRLKVSQAALFHRAQSKEVLMLRALRPGAPDAAAAFARGPAAGPVRPQLARLLEALLAYLHEVTPGLMVLRGAGVELSQALPGPGEPPTLMLRRLLAGWLQRANRGGQVQVLRVKSVAEALLGALEARAFNRYLGGPSFTPQRDAAFVAALVAGLVPRRARSLRSRSPTS